MERIASAALLPCMAIEKRTDPVAQETQVGRSFQTAPKWMFSGPSGGADHLRLRAKVAKTPKPNGRDSGLMKAPSSRARLYLRLSWFDAIWAFIAPVLALILRDYEVFLN